MNSEAIALLPAPVNLADVRNELRMMRTALKEIEAKIDLLEPAPHSSAFQDKTAREIARRVGVFYGYNLDQLMSRTRTASLAWARMMAMALMRETTAMSTPAIGHFFERDHGTVIHGIQRVSNICSTDRTRAFERDALRNAIRA